MENIIDRNLESPEKENASGKTCDICEGLGVVPETGTEDLWGDRCPNGCSIDRERLKAHVGQR